MNNVSVQMQLNQTSCFVVRSNEPGWHSFTDFVKISCPDLYFPIAVSQKDSETYHSCIMCGKHTNAAAKGRKINIHLILHTAVVAIICYCLFHQSDYLSEKTYQDITLSSVCLGVHLNKLISSILNYATRFMIWNNDFEELSNYSAPICCKKQSTSCSSTV